MPGLQARSAEPAWWHGRLQTRRFRLRHRGLDGRAKLVGFRAWDDMSGARSTELGPQGFLACAQGSKLCTQVVLLCAQTNTVRAQGAGALHARLFALRLSRNALRARLGGLRASRYGLRARQHSFVRKGKRLAGKAHRLAGEWQSFARRVFSIAGGLGLRQAGAAWIAIQWPCLGSKALRAALRPIDLASGARVGCDNVKSVKQGEGMLGTERFRGAWL